MPTPPGPALQSVLTCPLCGSAREHTMPLDTCIYFHRCEACGALLAPLPGHCCVFCSFGSVPCPPMQQAGGRCGGVKG